MGAEYEASTFTQVTYTVKLADLFYTLVNYRNNEQLAT
jgi:hypothetical protein